MRKSYYVIMAVITVTVILLVNPFRSAKAQSGQQVQGGVAAGTNPNVQYPVVIGAADGSGTVRTVKSASDGSLQIGGTVGISGTVPISGGFTPPNPCESNQVQSQPISITTATTTQLVAPSGTTVVTPCGLVIAMIGTITADTVQLVSGHGTNCGTGQASITGAMSSGILTAGATVVSFPGSMGSAPAGDGLCIVSTVGVGPSISGVLTFVRV